VLLRGALAAILLASGLLAGSALGAVASGDSERYCGETILLVSDFGGSASPAEAVDALGFEESDQEVIIDPATGTGRTSDGTQYQLTQDPRGAWRVESVAFTCNEVAGG
jgi:hypothetical protein